MHVIAGMDRILFLMLMFCRVSQMGYFTCDAKGSAALAIERKSVSAETR